MRKNMLFLNYNWKVVALILIPIVCVSGFVGGYYFKDAYAKIEQEEIYNEAYNLGYEYGFGNGSLVGYGYGYSNGSADTYSGAFLEGYNAGYSAGYNEAYSILENNFASLNITISPNFEFNITNDSTGKFANTILDIRKIGITSFTIDLNLVNKIYEYIELNENETIDIANETDIFNKLGIKNVQSGMQIINFADDWNLLNNWQENNRTVIDKEFVIAINQAFLPTFKIYVYANNSLFNATNYTEADNNPAFGFMFSDSISWIMGGGIFDNNSINDLNIIKSYNENRLLITSIRLDVDDESYVVHGMLNDQEVEFLSLTFF